MTENKYDKNSDKIFELECPECGKITEVYESYAYWFVEWQKMERSVKVTPTCRYCKKGKLEL